MKKSTVVDFLRLRAALVVFGIAQRFEITYCHNGVSVTIQNGDVEVGEVDREDVGQPLYQDVLSVSAPYNHKWYRIVVGAPYLFESLLQEEGGPMLVPLGVVEPLLKQVELYFGYIPRAAIMGVYEVDDLPEVEEYDV